MVRYGDSDAAGQQNGRVERRQAEGRNHAEGRIRVTTHMGRAIGRPGVLVTGPEDVVGPYLHALAGQPRYRESAGIEQRTEKGGEEHDLREDEPHHSHTERV